MFLAVFSSSLDEEKLEDGSSRIVLKLPEILTPIKAAILPLVKKDGLSDLAKKVYNNLKWDFNVVYDEKDAIGRRYRRQDAIGTPICVTIDHQTIKDEKVTLRDRDTMIQERIKIKKINEFLRSKLDFRKWTEKSGSE